MTHLIRWFGLPFRLLIAAVFLFAIFFFLHEGEALDFFSGLGRFIWRGFPGDQAGQYEDVASLPVRRTDLACDVNEREAADGARE